MKITVVISMATIMLFGSFAHAAKPTEIKCMKTEGMLDKLTAKYSPNPTWVGRPASHNRNGVVEMWANVLDGEWAFVHHSQLGWSCIISNGDNSTFYKREKI